MGKDNKLQRVAKNMLANEFNSVINLLKQQIVNIQHVDLEEPYFRTYFLPLIKKDNIVFNEDNVARFLHNYFMVTKSYHKGIRVIDPKTREELFVLPPLVMSIDDNNPFNKHISYSKLINKYNMMASNRQEQADQFLDKTLQQLRKEVLKPDAEEELYYIKNIYKMYKYYGLLEEANELEKDMKSRYKQEDLEDIFDYD